MSDVPSSFASALRAELDAVAARWEALARAHAELLADARAKEADGLRAELAEARAERDRLRAEGSVRDGELAALRVREADLQRELDAARARVQALEAEARSAGEAA